MQQQRKRMQQQMLMQHDQAYPASLQMVDGKKKLWYRSVSR